LPVTEQIAKRIVTLPFYTDLTEGEQCYIIERIKAYIQ